MKVVDISKGSLLSSEQMVSRTELPKLHSPGQLCHSNM